MLQAAERWGGGEGERPFLPRAFSVLRAPPAHRRELQFLIEDVGPGTKRLCELDAGDELLLRRSARHRLRAAPRRPARRCSSAVASGSRRSRSGRTSSPARAPSTLLGFRDAGARGRRGPARAARRSPPTTAASATTASSPSCSTHELDARGGRGRGVRLRPAGDARGGPGGSAPSAPFRRSSRSSPAWRAGSAPASAASSRPATATCACASTVRCSTRKCSRAPSCGRSAHRDIDRRRSAGSSSPTRSSTRSGTFDAIAARRAFGDELLERFPFAAFVSKTVTLEPRQGNPPPRLWELAGGLINSIGLPNKGLARLPRARPAEARRRCRCR